MAQKLKGTKDKSKTDEWVSLGGYILLIDRFTREKGNVRNYIF